MGSPLTPQDALRHATEAAHQAQAAVSVAASEAAEQHPAEPVEEEEK